MKLKLMAASLVAMGLFNANGYAASQVESAPAAKSASQAEFQLAQAAVPADVQALLNDNTALADMSQPDLAARIKALRAQMANKDLPREARVQLRDALNKARAELESRRSARQNKAKDKVAPAKKPAAAETGNEDAEAGTEPPAAKKKPAKEVVEQQPETAPAAPAEDKAAAKELDGNTADSAAEQQAKNYIGSASQSQGMSDKELRKRLADMRQLMSGNKLSAASEKQLRVLLRKEREELRRRVAVSNPAKPAPENNGTSDGGNGSPKGNPKIKPNTPRDVVLQDRRRGDDLQDEELSIRIRIWIDFQNTDRFRAYREDERREWIAQVNRDREILRRRLENRRNIRRAQLERPANINIVIRDTDAFRYNDLPADVFAEEVQDDDIERVLLAPPRRAVARKISVEEFAAKPQARSALTRIEVDTIRFGFNEAFVREEEVDSLDQIAAVIERVLKKYPREVFLIEGHTDAVGSDPYNAKLSKARAEAVKKALDDLLHHSCTQFADGWLG